MANRWRLQLAAALFSHAKDIELVVSNPFEGLRLERSQGRKHNVPLTEEGLYKVADTALVKCGAWGPTFRGLILFLGYTGMRPGEAFALTWKDVDVKAGTIRVRRRVGSRGDIDLPKSNRERTVLLPPPAEEALRSFPRGLDLVFRGMRGKPLRRSSVAHHWHKVRDDVGRPDLDMYELRHFCGHHLYVRMGLPARVVAVQLGHNDGGRLVEQLYGHGDIGALDELRAAWMRHMPDTRPAGFRSVTGFAKG